MGIRKPCSPRWCAWFHGQSAERLHCLQLGLPRLPFPTFVPPCISLGGGCHELSSSRENVSKSSRCQGEASGAARLLCPQVLTLQESAA